MPARVRPGSADTSSFALRGPGRAAMSGGPVQAGRLSP